MTKVSPRTSKRVSGVALILVSMLLTGLYTITNNRPSVDAAVPANKPVTGSVTITVKNGTVAVTFNDLAHIPTGSHATHLHKGSCPLNIPTPGQKASGADVILNPSNIVALGTLKSGRASQKFQAKVPAGANILGGGWFVCSHAGSLADVTNAADPVTQLGNDIQNNSPELQQIICTDIPPTGKTSETFNIQPPVTGSATIAAKNGTVTVTFNNLAHIPAGSHATHLHKGSCPLNIPTPGQKASGADVILNSSNIVALGTLKSGRASQKFQAKIPAGANILGGGWFVCSHAGSLADVGKAQNPVTQLGNDIQNNSPELQQIICVDIPPTNQTSETVKIKGVAKQ